MLQISRLKLKSEVVLSLLFLKGLLYMSMSSVCEAGTGAVAWQVREATTIPLLTLGSRLPFAC